MVIKVPQKMDKNTVKFMVNELLTKLNELYFFDIFLIITNQNI